MSHARSHHDSPSISGPTRRSLATGQVADLFGLAEVRAAARDCRKPRPSIFAPATLSSSWGRADRVNRRCSATAGEQARRDRCPCDRIARCAAHRCIPGPLDNRLAMLAGCGLSEARLLLRTPGELLGGATLSLSDGNALAQRAGSVSDRRKPSGRCAPGSHWIACDEFTATLERRWRRWWRSTCGSWFRAPASGCSPRPRTTTSATICNPDLRVRCGDGHIEAQRRAHQERPISFASELWLPKARRPTGRTSRGGIIAATTSPSPAA